MAVNAKINRRGGTDKRVITGPGQLLGPKSGSTRSDLRTLGGTLYPVDVYEVNDSGTGTKAASYLITVRPFAEGGGRSSVRSIGDIAVFKQAGGIASPTNSITCLGRKPPSKTGGAVTLGPFTLAAGDRLWALVARKDVSTLKYQIELVFNQVTISAQPPNRTITEGTNTTFTVTATENEDNATITYQWQVSTNGGTSYSNVTNAGVYTGATTATLTITNATVGLSANKYRVIVATTGNAPAVTSTAGTLTVNP